MSEIRAVDDSTSQRIRRAIEGESESLGWVVTRYSPLLKAQAAWRVGSRLRGQIDVEDVVAEAWLVLLRRRQDLVLPESRATGRLLKFLGGTILNLVNRRIADALRRGQNAAAAPQTPGSTSDPMDDLQATVTGAVTNAARDELGAALDACLAELPEKDRHVVLLRAVEGLTNLEAAAELGEPPNTVSHRYRRALEKLRPVVPPSFLDELPPE